MLKNIERKVFRKSYVMALSFIGLISIISFYVMESILGTQADFSHLLNISGRQRMLSQKISLEAERLIHNEFSEKNLKALRKDLDLFKESHQKIVTGTWADPSSELSANAYKIYYGNDALDAKVKNYISFIERIYNQNAEESYEEKKLNHLLFLLDKAVKTFEDESKGYYKQLYRVELTLVIITILAIFFVSLFIFEPYGKKLEDTLEQLIFEKKEAIQARELKSKFMANISHELRTPLHGIIGAVDLIHESQVDEHLQEYIQIIDSCAHTNLHLVNDLLDFEKLQRNEFHITHNWMSLSVLVEDLKRQFTFMATSKGLSFYVIGTKENLLICTDKLRLKQILTNIISNAIKYTHQGAVSIEILKEENKLRFLVKDTGVGISNEYRDKIFDDFFQVQEAEELNIKGTGLGLSISKRLASLLGGDILFYDNKQKGSVFEFNFSPELKRSEESPVQVINPENKQKTFPGLSVLFLEDNITNQTIFKRYLEKLKISYVMAINGKEGLELFDPRKFDIVFTDIQMPEMDGIEFFEKVKERFPENNRHIVAVTANALKEDIEKYKKLGFRAVLPKPTKLNELIILLENLISG